MNLDNKTVFASGANRGIGKATVDLLLTTFKSVKKVAQADLAELTSLVGPTNAAAVHRHFHPEAQ